MLPLRQQEEGAQSELGYIQTYLKSKDTQTQSWSKTNEKGNGLQSQCEPPKTQHGANMDVVSNHITSGTELRLECKHTWSAITQRAELA